MDMRIIEQKIASYKPQSRQEEFHCFKEVIQELALFALSRTDFFDKAAFMGGTALRILHALPRFSEDLDFSLLEPNPNFQWKPYLHELQEEFSVYGMSVEIRDRSELSNAVKRVFLKDNSFGQVLSLKYERKKSDSYVANIRLEIDTQAPLEAHSLSELGDFPLPYTVRVHDLPTLFAGKLNALLTRPFVKGRDWFDFVWYIGQKVSVNFAYLSNALEQFGVQCPSSIQEKQDFLITQLRKKVSEIDWNNAKNDVRLLLRDRDVKSIEFWTVDYFLQNVKQLDLLLRERSS